MHLVVLHVLSKIQHPILLFSFLVFVLCLWLVHTPHPHSTLSWSVIVNRSPATFFLCFYRPTCASIDLRLGSVVPFYWLFYSFVMCCCTSLVISNIDIWSVPKMSRNEASFTICRPSFGSCKLLALMYTHNALVISGRVMSPVMFNVVANAVDNCTFCVIIAGFFLGGVEASVG